LKLTTTVLFLTVPLALGGCGLVQQAEMGKAKERLVAMRADCRARYPDSHAKVADCFTAAENETVRPLAYNDADLLTVMQAKRKVMAVKEDRGEITKDEAQLEMAQFVSGLKDEDLQRMNAASAAAAQRSAASAQMLGAAATMLQASRPAPIVAPAAPSMVTTTCMPMGGLVNCTSH
jgi:hypothetical protein